MNKKYYWIGLPVCFVVMSLCTFLIPRTYESQFIIVKDQENSARHNQVLSMNKNENYDLGLIRTNSVYDMYAFREFLKSDLFVRPLLDMNVRTIDGRFDGTYYDYCTFVYNKPLPLKVVDKCLTLLPKKEKKDSTGYALPLDSKEQAKVRAILRRSLKSEVDYETEFVTFTCTSQDPLVSTMMGEGIIQEMNRYIASQNQSKMQVKLNELHQLTTQAKANYEQDRTAENEAIYTSFKRQEVIYSAQMHFTPSFTIIAPPSFDFQKAGPSRWKFPLLITLLIGLGMLCWDHKEQVVTYLKA